MKPHVEISASIRCMKSWRRCKCTREPLTKINSQLFKRNSVHILSQKSKVNNLISNRQFTRLFLFFIETKLWLLLVMFLFYCPWRQKGQNLRACLNHTESHHIVTVYLAAALFNANQTLNHLHSRVATFVNGMWLCKVTA